MMQFLIIAVASGSWTTDNRIAVVGKAAGKQVNATLASDGNGDVDVALQPRNATWSILIICYFSVSIPSYRPPGP